MDESERQHHHMFGNLIDMQDKREPPNIPHVVLQNGGYGNIVYNILFLLQLRI